MNDLKAQLQAQMDAAKAAYWASVKATRQAVVEVPPAPVCPDCNGTGMVWYHVPMSDPNFGKTTHCTNPNCEIALQNRQQAWEKRLRAAKLPALYERFTFDTWQKEVPVKAQREKSMAVNIAWTFVEAPNHRFALNPGDVERNWLMFYGPVGTGKTGLAAAITNALVDRGESVLYTRAIEIIESIKDTYEEDSQLTTRQVLEIYQKAPVLVIDEFNIDTRNKDHRRELMESVVRYRWGEQLPMIMTANVGPDEFTRMWGERTADVVKVGHWVEVAGTKLRATSQPIPLGR